MLGMLSHFRFTGSCGTLENPVVSRKLTVAPFIPGLMQMSLLLNHRFTCNAPLSPDRTNRAKQRTVAMTKGDDCHDDGAPGAVFAVAGIRVLCLSRFKPRRT